MGLAGDGLVGAERQAELAHGAALLSSPHGWMHGGAVHAPRGSTDPAGLSQVGS